MNPKLAGIIRHALTFAAGILVVTGKASPEDANTLAGGLMGLVGLGWSIFAPEKSA